LIQIISAKNIKKQEAASFEFETASGNIVAATYFTRFDPSIIGGPGLNFSVRDGKR
jgi:hypothetical protein